MHNWVRSDLIKWSRDSIRHTGTSVGPGAFPRVQLPADRVTQGLAWEVDRGPPLIIEKNGGLNNTTTYMGMMPGEKLGVVILSNLGSENAGAGIGRRIMRTLAPSLVR